MKAREIRAKTKDELIAELANTQKEQFNLKMQKKTGGIEGSAPKMHDFKRVQRKIARIKTILKERSDEV